MVEDIVRSKGYLTLGSRMRRIGERLQAETQQVMAWNNVPIQANQYPLLAALDENGPLSVNELAEALGVSQPGITRNIGQLKKQDIVIVLPGETDRRTRVVSLTELGRAIVRQGRAEVWPLLEACIANIMADASGTLLQQLDHLEQGLEEASFLKRIAQTEEKPADG